jgi:hypothetical protein
MVEAVRSGDRADVLEVRLNQDGALTERTQLRSGARDCRWICIQAQQSAVRFGGLQDPESVPSATERRVDLEAAREW